MRVHDKVYSAGLYPMPLYKLLPPAAKSGEPAELLVDHMLPTQAGPFTHREFEDPWHEPPAQLQAKKSVGQG